MRNFLKTTTLILVLGLVTLINGCAKDGKDGVPGPTGTSGTNGNANVKSLTFTVNTWEWVTSGNTVYVNRTPDISTDIFNSGSVLLYIKSSTAWQALPFTYPQGTFTTLMRYLYSYNFVQINVMQESGTPSLPTTSLDFKLVTISSTARLSNPQVDFNDYYQVKAAFNLKD